jgi:hypothetical protein
MKLPALTPTSPTGRGLTLKLALIGLFGKAEVFVIRRDLSEIKASVWYGEAGRKNGDQSAKTAVSRKHNDHSMLRHQAAVSADPGQAPFDNPSLR